MNLEALQAEIRQVEQAGTRDAIQRFFVRHPALFALATIVAGGQWLFKACLWTIALLLAVVGLKVLWLAVRYMWSLV